MINLIILGAGGHTKEVYTTIQHINRVNNKKYNLLGFFDDITDNLSLLNLEVF